MTTIGSIIRSMMPSGTDPGRDDAPGWATCPIWPPDLFAVTATLIERTGIYSHAWLYAQQGDPHAFSDVDRRQIVESGAVWRQTGQPDSSTQRQWSEVFHACDNVDLDGLSRLTTPSSLARHLVHLLCTADEAAIGMGFIRADGSSSDFARAVIEASVQADISAATGRLPGKQLLPHFPTSLTIAVTPSTAVVMPKSRLPDVGCTLRSLSHNLALLPPSGVVEATWLLSDAEPLSEGHAPMGILLIPRPFRAKGNVFRVERHGRGSTGYFTVDVAGFNDAVDVKDKDAARLIADEISNLIKAAEDEVGIIHAVILPECALPAEIAADVARRVGRQNSTVTLFVTGAIGAPAGVGNMPRNLAVATRFSNGVAKRSWIQSKHHRWKLTGDQIRRYHMGHVLDPTRDWWEHIDVSGRTCHFSVIDNNISLAVLICEDLARFDPVLPVINAIGPTLVVALLMDGPQLEKRWPGRYATVLAEDPGSSVLTFTSTALIDRQAAAGAGQIRTIALWKQPGGIAQELSIGPNDHALALCLVTEKRAQMTIDGRERASGGTSLSLAAFRPVRPQTGSGRGRRKPLNKGATRSKLRPKVDLPSKQPKAENDEEHL